MSNKNKFGLLRKVLHTIGLSQQSADDAIQFITDLLAGERHKSTSQSEMYPYQSRDHFLSPAELNFYKVLQFVVNNKAIINCKVNLSDIIWVKSNDPSTYRIYTNKIDRKHVDFLLCHPQTLQPLLALELDDKSHQRKDRKERDAFVDSAFKAAGIAVLHIPARRAYKTEQIQAHIAPYLLMPMRDIVKLVSEDVTDDTTIPICPKCGQVMILRTAKKGANAGNQFWGCSNYPACRAIVPYEEIT